MAEEITRERIEELARKLYYPEDGEATAEDLEEARSFTEGTLATIAASPLAYRNLGLFLGIKEADLPPAPEPAAPKPDEGTPQPTEDELIEALRLQTAEGTGFELDPTLFRSTILASGPISEEGSLLAGAASYGTGDTAIREAVHSALSRTLLGRNWPTYGDRLSADELNGFLTELKAAHDERVASAA